MRTLAHTLISKARTEMENLSYPRAKAYTMCGLYEMLRAGVDADSFESIFLSHADSLVDLYETNRKEGWEWFEPTVTYSNAKLSESLILAYKYTRDRTYRRTGLATLDFLTEIQWKGDFFDIVGNKGWYRNNFV